MRNVVRAGIAAAATVPMMLAASGMASAQTEFGATAMELGPVIIVSVSGAEPEAECVTVPPQVFGGTADADGNAFLVLLSATDLVGGILVTCTPGALIIPDVTTAEVESGSLES
ncbi:hypothetical protein [Lolliginicoccus suaedae]|uniref:hypothetical protein n=1 Tax=Lolliginicoccus suaedae TaxID=2605429 RepID=UPI0011EEE9D2|nr:hypothetical protein [Lolliginicoccus suaedae]